MMRRGRSTAAEPACSYRCLALLALCLLLSCSPSDNPTDGQAGPIDPEPANAQQQASALQEATEEHADAGIKLFQANREEDVAANLDAIEAVASRLHLVDVSEELRFRRAQLAAGIGDPETVAQAVRFCEVLVSMDGDGTGPDAERLLNEQIAYILANKLAFCPGR